MGKETTINDQRWADRVSLERGRADHAEKHALRLTTERDGLIQQLQAEKDNVSFYRNACSRQHESICQSLGQALGYTRFADHPEIFPGVDPASPDVCVGDHVAESLADEAGKRIRDLTAEVERLKRGES